MIDTEASSFICIYTFYAGNALNLTAHEEKCVNISFKHKYILQIFGRILWQIIDIQLSVFSVYHSQHTRRNPTNIGIPVACYLSVHISSVLQSPNLCNSRSPCLFSRVHRLARQTESGCQGQRKQSPLCKTWWGGDLAVDGA